MIAIDTSAIIVILFREPEYDKFVRIVTDADRCLVSAVSYLEASLVLVGRGAPTAVEELEALVRRVEIEVVPFDFVLATQASNAFIRFGKGRHPASLNFGDCASYALAQARGVPLLYKGGDFARTDVIGVQQRGG